MEKNKKKLSYRWIIYLLALILFAVLALMGLKSYFSFDLPIPSLSEIFNFDPIMGYKEAEIVEMIDGENRETQELKVYEQDLEAAQTITDTFLNIDWFRKSQTIHMFSTASFTIDLSKVTQEDIIIDEKEKTITVVIPKPELDMLEMDYEKTTFDEVDREILGWGDIELTPEQQNELELQLQDAMKEQANEEEYLEKAQDSAKKQVENLYRRLLKELDEEAQIIIVFDRPEDTSN